MAGCVPCFIIPLLLFIFHRYIQPIILKFWNPWENSAVKQDGENEKCKFNCDCSWNKKKEVENSSVVPDVAPENQESKLKAL